MLQQAPTTKVLRNRLLACLPPGDRDRFLAMLEPLSLPLGHRIYEVGAPIEYAYFPAGAVLSALTIMLDGNAIEVATTGCEGVVGHLHYGERSSPHRVVAQIPGDALRIPIAELEQAAERMPSLRGLLAAYQGAFLGQVSQSVACNGLHRLEQRCCRWLLMSRDRVESDDVRLTHEYLAIMLGARRASVTEVLRPLQEAGLVRSQRGQITILDGPGLEARSCECYAVVRDRYDRLFGGPRR